MSERMARVFLVSCAASLAMFVWGFLFWAVAPPSVAGVRKAPDEFELAERLQRTLLHGGTYMLPYPGDDAMTMTRLSVRGPIVTLFYRPEGVVPMSPAVFFWGYVHMLFTAFLLGLVLQGVGGRLAYGRRVALVALIGLASGVWAELGDPIWFYHPWGYHIATACYGLVSWVIAGLILARFIPARP